MEMKSILLFLVLVQGILNHVVMGEPLYADIFRCKKDSGDFLPKSTYETNLLDAVKIASEAAKTSTYFYSKGGSRVVAAESFCAAYLKHVDCVSCVNTTFPLLLKNCQNKKHALAWRSKCMVEYGLDINLSNHDHWFVAHETSANKTKDIQGLENTMKALVDKLLKEALKNKENTGRYAYGTMPYNGSRQTLFMVMQCSYPLSEQDCNKCLLRLYGEMKPCCSGAIAAATLTSGCYMRYAHDDFRSR
ncbi:putative Gnk2-like domain-containing protein [Helianthus debilis subsp. tardiflorus]